MNQWSTLQRHVEEYRKEYPPGTRILLQHMGRDSAPVDDNARGTVIRIDDIGTLHCQFDNGRVLGIIAEEDRFRKLTERELLKERTHTKRATAITSEKAR